MKDEYVETKKPRNTANLDTKKVIYCKPVPTTGRMKENCFR